jgi:hypothetical protein
MFVEQIFKNGSIENFSEANYIYESIINSEETDYFYFNSILSNLRESLKLNLDTYREDAGFESIEFGL